MNRKLVTRFATGTAAAALALGGVACDTEGAGGDLDPGQEAPEDDLGGEGGGLEGDGGAEDGGLEDEGGDF